MITIDNISEANELINILKENNINFNYCFDDNRSNSNNDVVLTLLTNENTKKYIKHVDYKYFSNVVKKLFKKNNIVTEYDIIINCKNNNRYFKPYSLFDFSNRFARENSNVTKTDDFSLDCWVLISKKDGCNSEL